LASCTPDGAVWFDFPPAFTICSLFTWFLRSGLNTHLSPLFPVVLNWVVTSSLLFQQFSDELNYGVLVVAIEP
jgi:hypothetical protein